MNENLEIVPVNQTCLVRCIPKSDWETIRGTKTDGPVKVTEHLYAPDNVSAEHDPDDQIEYDQGVVEKLGWEEVPFDVRVGDYVVYNHGGVVHWDKAKNIKKKIVKYQDIIVIFREQKEQTSCKCSDDEECMKCANFSEPVTWKKKEKTNANKT